MVVKNLLDNTGLLITLLSIVALVIAVVFFPAPTQKPLILNCEQYNAIPERYVEKVPDGCVAKYFEYKEKVKTDQLNERQKLRDER